MAVKDKPSNQLMTKQDVIDLIKTAIKSDRGSLTISELEDDGTVGMNSVEIFSTGRAEQDLAVDLGITLNMPI